MFSNIISLSNNVLKLNNIKITSPVFASFVTAGNSVFIVENSIFEDFNCLDDYLFNLNSYSSFVDCNFINCSSLNDLFYAKSMDMINVNISNSSSNSILVAGENGKVNLNNVKISNISVEDYILNILQCEFIADKLSIVDSSLNSGSNGLIHINHKSSVVNINNSVIRDNNLTNIFRVVRSGANLTVSNSEFYDNNALSGDVVYISAVNGANVDADYNWWGSNEDPNTKVTGASIDKWIVMNITTDLPEGNISGGDKVSITADFNHYATKDSETISDYDFKVNDLSVSAGSEKGSLDKASAVTSNGIAKIVYTAVDSGEDSINISSANQLFVIPVTVNDLFTDIYVRPDGNDSNNGLSNENALASIKRAVEIAFSPAAASEVTIHIANGEYLETDVVVSANKTIKFVGEEKDKVIVLVNGSSATTGISGNTSQNSNLYSYDVSFENIVFTAASGSKSNALFYMPVSQAKLNLEFVNCTVCNYSAYYAGISASSSTAGSSLTLIDCSINNLNSTASNAYGGLIYLGSQVKLNVNHSAFYNNKVTGVSSGLINNVYCNQGLSINYSSFYNNDIASGRLMQSGKTLDANYNYYGTNDNPSAFTTLSNNNWVIMTSSNNLSGASLNPGESVELSVEFNILTDSTGTNSTFEGEVAPILVKFEANHGNLSQSEVWTDNNSASVVYTLDTNERYEVLANSNIVFGRFVDYVTTISPTNINYYIKGDSVYITINNVFNSSFEFSEVPFYAFIGEEMFEIDGVKADNETIRFNLASLSDNLTEGLNNISFHPLLSDLEAKNLRDWDFENAYLTVNVLNSKITDIYVSPDGNNSNDGLSEDKALATIAAAVDLSKSAYASDDITIHIANGVYTENLGGSGNSIRLAPKKNTIIVGAEKGKVILLATGVLQPTYNNQLYMNRYFSVTEMNSIANLTFENLSFVNFTSSGATGAIINTNGNTNVDFINCTFENVNAGQPFSVAGNARFIDSSFINVTPTSSLDNVASTSSMFWSNNAISINITSCEIRGSTFNDTKALLGSQRGSPTFIIENSAIYDNVIVEGTVLARSDNTFILNNNYWGTNENPSTIVGKTVGTWVIMSISPAEGESIRVGETIDFVVDFMHINSTDGTVSELTAALPEILVKFSSEKGGLNVTEIYTEDGIAQVTYTSLSEGKDHITVSSDNVEIIVPISVTKDVDLSIGLDDDNNVIVILKDNEGNLIDGADIKYAANDNIGTLTTDENGTAIVPDLEGKVDLKLEFVDESGIYTPTNLSAMLFVVKTIEEINITIKPNATITLSHEEGSDIVEISLADLEGSAIPDASLDVFVNEVFTSVNDTDSEGKSTVYVSGNSTVIVSYTDANNITVSSSIVVIYDTKELTDLIDELKNNLTNAQDDLAVANEKVDNLTSDLAVANEKVDNLTSEVSNLNATVNDQAATIKSQADAIDNLNATVEDLNNKINDLMNIIEELNKTTVRTATQIIYSDMETVSVSSLDGRVGEYFVVKLVDANGTAMANKKIAIGFNGKIYNRTTDENGSAKLQINLPAKGTYTFAIAYLGDDEYNGTFEVAKIVVTSQTPKLTTSSKTYKATVKTKTLTATFKTVNGNPIKGKKISFTVNGKTYTGTTNANGVASVKVSLSKKGTYSFTAKYVGDKVYSAISKSAKLTIK